MKLMQKASVAGLAAMAILAAVVLTAGAGVIRLDNSDDFTAAAGLITFSEFPVDTVNPTYTPDIYRGGAGGPTVTFGGFFAGQSQPGTRPPCPALGALTGCVTGTPSSPLALDAAAPGTVIADDIGGQRPTTPVLSGSPKFNGPIAILFSVDVAGVGLNGGVFDDIGGTAIDVYDRNGKLLGSVANRGFMVEFLGLATDDGLPHIAGLLFHIVGREQEGFGIDNVQFGPVNEVVVPGVPLPGTLLLLGSGLVGMTGIAWRRRRR